VAWKTIKKDDIFNIEEPTVVRIDGKLMVYCVMQNYCKGCKLYDLCHIKIFEEEFVPQSFKDIDTIEVNNEYTCE
jgi:hypothetical protein